MLLRYKVKKGGGQDKDGRNIPLTEDQIQKVSDYADHFDDLIDVIQRKDGSVRMMPGKKINGHTIIVETVSKGRNAIHPVTAYQIDTNDYLKNYKTRAIDRSSTSRSASADTVDISRPAIAPVTNSISENDPVVKNNLQQGAVGSAEQNFSGKASYTENLDIKIQKLHRLPMRMILVQRPKRSLLPLLSQFSSPPIPLTPGLCPQQLLWRLLIILYPTLVGMSTEILRRVCSGCRCYKDV